MTTVLPIKERSCASKGTLHHHRQEGWTPCIVYGNKKDPEKFYVKTKEFLMEMHKEGVRSRIFHLKDEKVLIKSIDFQPTKDIPLHVDFIRLGQRITLSLPLRFLHEEKCPGLKRGGVLNIIHHELKVSVSSENIPQYLDINLENIALGQTVHLGDIHLPEGVKILSLKPTESLLSIVSPAGAKDDDKSKA